MVRYGIIALEGASEKALRCGDRNSVTWSFDRHKHVRRRKYRTLADPGEAEVPTDVSVNNLRPQNWHVANMRKFLGVCAIKLIVRGRMWRHFLAVPLDGGTSDNRHSFVARG